MPLCSVVATSSTATGGLLVTEIDDAANEFAGVAVGSGVCVSPSIGETVGIAFGVSGVAVGSMVGGTGGTVGSAVEGVGGTVGSTVGSGRGMVGTTVGEASCAVAGDHATDSSAITSNTTRNTTYSEFREDDCFPIAACTRK